MDQLDTWQGCLISIFSFVFYSQVQVWISNQLINYEEASTRALLTELTSREKLANWITSALHASLAALGDHVPGWLVVWQTWTDILFARSSPWVQLLAFHSFGYFIYDTRCLFHLYSLAHQPNYLLHRRLLWRFERTSLLIHHLGVLFVFTPIVLYLRRGLGDCFVGICFLMEASTPLVAFKAIMDHLGTDRQSRLYLVNFVMMLSLFFCLRLCSFPLLYWLYAYQSNTSVASVLANLRWHCNLGTLGLICFQSFWFVRMCQALSRTISASRKAVNMNINKMKKKKT